MVKQIELRKKDGPSVWALVDDADYSLVSHLRWRAKVESHTTYVYAHTPMVGGVRRTVKMHRMVLGLTDADPGVDHLDGDGLNNCRSNLRVASQRTQVVRQGPRGSSGFKGVSFSAGRWRARLALASGEKHLGRYDTAEEAARAYDTAALEHWGEDAYLNFSTGQRMG